MAHPSYPSTIVLYTTVYTTDQPLCCLKMRLVNSSADLPAAALIIAPLLSKTSGDVFDYNRKETNVHYY
jgi:hypothetical protein